MTTPTPEQLAPCEHRHSVICGLLSPVREGEGHEPVAIVSCKLLDAALGWWHGSSSNLCKQCREHYGARKPENPKYGGADPISKEFTDVVLAQLAGGVDDAILKQVIGNTRDDLIRKAKALGASNDHIANLIVASVHRHRFGAKAALEMADRHELFEDKVPDAS